MTDMNKEREDFYAWLRTYEAEVGAVDEASAWVGFLGGRASLAASAGSEPVARLLHWHGPSHYPVPHGGIAARTFAEFPKEEAEKPDAYWRNGAPLYTQAEPTIGNEQLALKALRYYRDECTGAEPSISVFHQMLEEALSTHPSPPEGAGWRPIETAPKDGTWIELWRTPTDFGRMSPFVIARWDGTESMFVWPEFCDPFTKYGRDKADADIAEGDCYGSDDFTHWRALSSPPASEAKGA